MRLLSYYPNICLSISSCPTFWREETLNLRSRWRRGNKALQAWVSTVLFCKAPVRDANLPLPIYSTIASQCNASDEFPGVVHIECGCSGIGPEIGMHPPTRVCFSLGATCHTCTATHVVRCKCREEPHGGGEAISAVLGIASSHPSTPQQNPLLRSGRSSQ